MVAEQVYKVEVIVDDKITTKMKFEKNFMK